jgi:hypothetical protein
MSRKSKNFEKNNSYLRNKFWRETRETGKLFPGKQGNRETAFLILQGKQGNRETALAANRETRETVSLFPSCCFFPKTLRKWF